MSDDLKIILLPNPFSTERKEFSVPAQGSILDVLDRMGACFRAPIDARVYQNDQPIERERWGLMQPDPGNTLAVRIVPHGPDGKDPLRALMTIAVVALSWGAGSWVAGALSPGSVAGTAAGALTTAGLTYAGMHLVNALIPPPTLPASIAQGKEGSQSFGIQGASNEMRPFGAVPHLFGRDHFFPPFGSQPYTEIHGDDVFLRMLFVLGRSMQVEEMRIGETRLQDFLGEDAENAPWNRVWYYVHEEFDPDTDDLQIVTDDTYQESLSIVLEEENGYSTRTTAADTDEIVVDITAPNGVCRIENDGSKSQASVQLEVQYATAGSGSWTAGETGKSVSQTEVNLTQPEEYFDYAIGAFATGYRAIRVGIDKASGLPGVLYGLLRENELSARRQAPVYPPHMAPICMVIRNSDKATVEDADIIDERNDELQASGSDFAASEDSPPGDHVVIAAGTLQAVQTIYGKRTTTIRKAFRFPVDKGKYDVRVRRITPSTEDDSQTIDTIAWTSLKSIRHIDDPVQLSGLTLVEMRVRASEELNGIIDSFNVIATAKVNDWNGVSWEVRPTRNPASAFRELLQCDANKRPLADSRLDLDQLTTWHEDCESNGYTFDQYIDYRSSVQAVAANIAHAGRASLTYKDGKYSILMDRTQSTPIQHFTPRNSFGFKGQKFFPNPPHGFRVRFKNEDKDWKTDEATVYNDGYNETNATELEQLDLPGITNYDLVWKHGRFHLAQLELRPEEYSIQTDVENIRCTRGDLVRVAHDVTLWGLSWGRVKEVQDNGTHATGVTLDEYMTMEGGKSYNLRFRLADSSTLVASIVTQAGSYQTVTFTTPILLANAPEAGDLAMFGEADEETVECLVKAVKPGPGLSATLYLADYSSGIYTADTEEIPPFDSHITLPARPKPPRPIIESITSDETVLVRQSDGSLAPRIVLKFDIPPGFEVLADIVEAEIRPDHNAWMPAGKVNAFERQISFTEVEEGLVCDVRIRLRTKQGLYSPWNARSHTVVGKSSAPPDVERLLLEGDVIKWQYPNPPVDFAGFELRHRGGTGRNWDGAIKAHDDLLKTTIFPVGSLPGGLRTYMVKAVDTSGNMSENAALLVANLGDEISSNLVLEGDPDYTEIIATRDLTAYRNDGVFSGVPCFGTGWYGRAALKNVSGAAYSCSVTHVDCGNGAPLNALGGSGFSILIRYSDPQFLGGLNTALWSKYQNSSNYMELRLNVSGQVVVYLYAGGSGSSHTFSASIPCDGSWHDILAVFDLTNDLVHIYIDGVENDDGWDINGLPSAFSNTANFCIGARSDGTARYWGYIDECRVYSGALSSKKAELLADNIDVSDTLLGHWDFEDAALVNASEGVAHDLYGLSNNLNRFWLDNDDANFWNSDPDANFWGSRYESFSYQTSFVPDADALPAELLVSIDISGLPWEVLYRTGGDSNIWYRDDDANIWGKDDDDNFWDPVGEWLHWPGRLSVSRQRYQFRLNAGPGYEYGYLDDLKFQLDVPDIVERQEDISISSGGTRLTLTETYRAISNISLTLQYDGGDAAYAIVNDKVATPGAGNGPEIECFDIFKQTTAGSVDVTIQGY